MVKLLSVTQYLPLTEGELVDVQKMCDEATAGPWIWWSSNSWLRLSSERGGDGDVLHPTVNPIDHHPSLTCKPSDRLFISEARTIVPRLLATVRARGASRLCCICGDSMMPQTVARLHRTRCADPDGCRRRAESTRRFWNGHDGGATFSVVAKDAANALLLIAEHCVTMGCTDESSSLSVDEVDREHARTVQIGGDEPCLFFDMEYGDVASSEY